MGFVKTAYLVLYNLSCCAGWAVVLYFSIQTLLTSEDSLKDALASVYNASTALPLTLAQSAALLEIGHALLGLVRSPVIVTFLQVMSRIVALYALSQSPDAQSTSWIQKVI